MACWCQTAEALLPELEALQQRLNESAEEAVSFRKWNQRFDKRNETTQLLHTVAEQLWNEKLSMEQANFEEHTSELSYLCQHFRSRVDQGLTDAIYAEKVAALQAKRRNSGQVTEAKPRRFFSSCCSSDFPPQQGWWLDTVQSLVPKFQVLRGSKLTLSAATDLVPGDIIYICAGQQAAVDARVLLTSDVTAVDASHLTSRCNDVRICSPSTSASSVIESRNIVLKDSHIISGCLFCMVLRSSMDPCIPASAYGGQETYEATVDTAVPTALSLGACQGLFKTLCSKSGLFCKSFKTIEQIGNSHYVVVLLTQELLSKGTVPAFCNLMQKLRKALILVNCDCKKEQVMALCQNSDVTCADFEDAPTPAGQARGGGHFEDTSEIASTASIDLSLCTFPVGMERVGDYEQAKLKSLLDKLQTGNPVAVLVHGISQIGLLMLCKQLSHPEKPMLYAMSNFHYSKCFRSLAVESVRQQQQRMNPSVVGASEESTNIGTNSRASPASGGEKPPSPYEVLPTKQGDCIRVSTESIRTDPAPHFKVDQPQSASQRQVVSRGAQVFVSINSIGIVSEHSDCILLKPDLGCLGQAVEVVAKKLRR